jgi:hypothetical protein
METKLKAIEKKELRKGKETKDNRVSTLTRYCLNYRKLKCNNLYCYVHELL